jgi:NADH:ubiquinone oxidoreductase subunit F (NADH-binding)
MRFTEAIHHRSEKTYKIKNKSTHSAEDGEMNGKAKAGEYLHGHNSALRLSLEGKHSYKKSNYPQALRNYLF